MLSVIMLTEYYILSTKNGQLNDFSIQFHPLYCSVKITPLDLYCYFQIIIIDKKRKRPIE